MKKTYRYWGRRALASLLCTIMILGVLCVYPLQDAHAAFTPVPFSSEGIFGVPVDDQKVTMRSYNDHSNLPKGIDLQVGYGTDLYAPFAGDLQYYRVSAILSSGERETISYGHYLKLTSTINGTKYEFLVAHMDSFAEGYPLDGYAKPTHSANTITVNGKTYGERSASNPNLKGKETQTIGSLHHVKEGEFIGKTGNCGYSSGDHAHIELRVNGTLVDPDKYITNTFTSKSRYTGSDINPSPVPPVTDDDEEEMAIYQCTTTSASLNIRCGPGTHYEKIGSIPSKAKVEAKKLNSDWAYVRYDGKSGYASMQYLTKTNDGTLFLEGINLKYTAGSTFPVKNNGISAARQFADYCETMVYGESRTLVPGGFALFTRDENTIPSWYGSTNGVGLLCSGWVATLMNGNIYVVQNSSSSKVVLLSLGSGNVIQRTVMSRSDAITYFGDNPIKEIELWNNTGLGSSTSPDDVSSTVSMPEIIIHIDSPKGSYDGSNHIEISGWIASMHSVTYIMGECEAFGQMNLTSSITDASAELDGAGYSSYPYKVRYSSVIDRKYLQPNTTYTMKVWAGMTNGVTSGVCGQKFDVTSIEPTLITITSPSASSFAGGKDVAVAGYIQSLNPITDISGRIADINGSTQELDFDLSLTTNSSVVSSTYTYGYSFSGTMPLSLVSASDTTATLFVTSTDENNIQKTTAKTFVIGSVVRGDINSYEFVYNQEYVRIYNQDTQTLSGTVYANAPIADVMAQIYQWANEGGIIITTAKVTEVTPKAGYQYAKTFELNVSAGDLCDILGVDSFTDNEFRVLFWCDLVGSDGQGVHLESADQRKIYGNNVQMVNYTVTYNANGGSGGPSSSQTFKHRKGVTLSSAVPSRTGYSFRGWTTSATSNQVKYVPGSTYNTNSNATLYAVWQKAIDIPTNLVDYDFSAAVTIANAPKVYKFVPSTTTKYRFTASGSAGANVVIQNASGATVASMSGSSSATKEVLLNDNTVYYIVAKPNTANATGTVNVNILRSYAIDFDANGGTGAPTDTLYQFAGENVTLPTTIPTTDPVTVSFVADASSKSAAETHECPVLFDGWANYDYRSYSTWESGESTIFERSLTLQAEWYHQSLNDLGIYEIPEKEGMIFCGWADENGYIVEPDTVVLEDETYYAQWISATPLEGLKVTPKSMELEVGDSAQLTVSAVPSDANLPEITWTSSNPDTATVTQTGRVDVLSEGASTITASCADGFSASAVIVVGTPVFTVSYDSNGGTGSVPESVVLNYGDPYTVPDEVPTRTGYTFLGWAKDANASTGEWNPGDAISVEKSMTLYAVWYANRYQVNYDANGGTGAPEAQTKIHDIALTLSSSAPSRENYSFGGWALNPAASQADYLPGDSFEMNAEVTLYALWRAKATGISLNYPSLVLNVGEQATLTPVFQPAEATGGTVTWFSSDDQVVTVTNRKVFAVGAGSATITCTAADNTELTASCKVTVVKGASQDGDAPDAPETLQITAQPGQSVQVNLKFNSTDAAFAKLLFSYDTNAMNLTSVTANGGHVTLGTNTIVMAVSNGKIPDGVQAVLNFDIATNAAPGAYNVNVIVTECYTIDEANSNLYAVAADTVQVICQEHTLLMTDPILASSTENGLSAGWSCEVCGSTLTQQQVINADHCYWMPSGLKMVGEEAMTGLPVQQIVLSNDVQSIANKAFKDCKELLIIVIPSGVQEIAPDAFDGCDALCIVTEDGSYAQTFATENNIPCCIQ